MLRWARASLVLCFVSAVVVEVFNERVGGLLQRLLAGSAGEGGAGPGGGLEGPLRYVVPFLGIWVFILAPTSVVLFLAGTRDAEPPLRRGAWIGAAAALLILARFVWLAVAAFVPGG